MKETKIYADEFCTTFASTTEMLEFLAERAKQSKWIRKPTRMLKLVPLEKEAETIEEACEKELEGIVEDTEKNTQLVLKVNKDFYPVRDCAIDTILKRAGINGTGLKKLEKATYAKVVNYCLQVAKGDALIKVADGKVSAVHGGDDHDYCVLDMQTIFNMTSDYLKAHFKVMAFPQDYAAMMTMIEKLQQIPKVVGIDIGGFTTDYLLMRKGNPDMEACDSMEKGVITMYNKIISGINSEYDILLEESDIDSILQGNTEFYEEAVVRMTEGMVQDFVKDLLNSIRERGIDTKAAYTVFIGGGAKLLSHFLEQSDRLGKYTFIEDISANAKGYDRLFQIM